MTLTARYPWPSAEYACAIVGLLPHRRPHPLLLESVGVRPPRGVALQRETIRLIAEISMGTGALAVFGGTVVIVGFLTLATGGTLACRVTARWAISASRR